MFRDAIRRGVSAGMSQAMGPGSTFSTALHDALENVVDPWRQEVRKLRKIEGRLKWHPIEKLPDWAKDGRPVWVARDGDVFVAAYVSEPDAEPYWDLDTEYGGTTMEPPPTHFFLLPRPPRDGASSRPPVIEGESSREAPILSNTETK